jgi:hypothetical protein
MMECVVCHGKGKCVYGCEDCDGKGTIEVVLMESPPSMENLACPRCKATGYADRQPSEWLADVAADLKRMKWHEIDADAVAVIIEALEQTPPRDHAGGAAHLCVLLSQKIGAEKCLLGQAATDHAEAVRRLHTIAAILREPMTEHECLACGASGEVVDERGREDDDPSDEDMDRVRERMKP